jgi:DNA-binding IclR family transcriptional regulator
MTECTIDRLIEASRELADRGEPVGVMVAWVNGEPEFRVRLVVGAEVMVFATASGLESAITRAASVAEQIATAERQVEFAEAASWG